jgi:hypothetical protein
MSGNRDLVRQFLYDLGYFGEKLAGRFFHPGTAAREYLFAFAIHDLNAKSFGRLVDHKVFLKVL